jgi:Kef-type K+ transport system membrane component KefB
VPLISGWMHDRTILPVRIALLILLGLVSLANELGMELVLGAYTAGVVVEMLVRDTRAEILENRLASIGSGFFIPLFFITSGVEFDLGERRADALPHADSTMAGLPTIVGNCG